jgi:hypothetical protein
MQKIKGMYLRTRTNSDEDIHALKNKIEYVAIRARKLKEEDFYM